MVRILTIIPDKEVDLQLAGIAATALCGSGLTQAFPGNLPSRPSVAGLQVQCDPANAPRVKAGFVRAGFDTIENVPLPDIPPKTNIVTITIVPTKQAYLQMADPAADALCGAGLTVAYDDGRSYSGDISTDPSVDVRSDQVDVPTVQNGFLAVWLMLAALQEPSGQ